MQCRLCDGAYDYRAVDDEQVAKSVRFGVHINQLGHHHQSRRLIIVHRPSHHIPYMVRTVNLLPATRSRSRGRTYLGRSTQWLPVPYIYMNTMYIWYTVDNI